MSANPQIPFLHHRVADRDTLIESVCPGCGDFVAASSDQKNLMIAEAAHVCDYPDRRQAAEIGKVPILKMNCQPLCSLGQTSHSFPGMLYLN